MHSLGPGIMPGIFQCMACRHGLPSPAAHPLSPLSALYRNGSWTGFAVLQQLQNLVSCLSFHTYPMSTGVESNQHWWDELFDIGRVSSTLGCCEQDRWVNLYLKLCNASTCNSTSPLTEQRSSEADAVHYASSQTRARWQPHYAANEVAG